MASRAGGLSVHPAIGAVGVSICRRERGALPVVDCHDLTYTARQERSGYLERHFPELALLAEIERLEDRLGKYKYWCAGARRLRAAGAA